MSNWTLLSNHGHVLVCLSRDPEARLRDVAADVGITERAVQKIVRDLQDGGMISVTKSGRRNCYRIHKKQSLRHELEAACTLQDLIKVVNKAPGTQLPDANSVKKTEAAVRRKSEPLERVVERVPEPASKPPPIKPKAGKPAADKTADPGNPNLQTVLKNNRDRCFKSVCVKTGT